MTSRKLWAAALLLVSFAASAAEPANIIFITWDGVRWQEMFKGEDPTLGGAQSHLEVFPRMKARLAWNEAALLGDRVTSTAKVSNPVAISLPAYESMMAGRTTGCITNDCGQIKHETFLEAALKDGMARKDVAVFGSWDKIEQAAEQTPGAVVTNTGITPMHEPDALEADATMAQINQAQAGDVPPWGDARYDRYTWEQAMHYLRTYQPRFMYVSLNDSDEHGHRNEYREYLETLHQYDSWLDELIQELKQTEHGRNTIVIVTTDHGRGEGAKWTDHYSALPTANWIWMFAEDLSGQDRIHDFRALTRVEHKNLRKTFEGWLGIPLSPAFDDDIPDPSGR